MYTHPLAPRRASAGRDQPRRRRALPGSPLWAGLTALLLAACGGGGGDGGGGGGANPGAARSVGPDLSQLNADNPVRCIDGYPLQDVGGGAIVTFLNTGQGSCLVVAPLLHNPGAPGVAVSASIKVGATTGPMRFVRMRDTLSAIVNGEACCSLEQYGTVFTPAPNSTTTVALNFQMEWEPKSAPNPSPVIVQDLVALEILDPFVPWPGTWPLGGRNDLLRANFIYAPAISAAGYTAPTQNLRGGSFNGFVPSFAVNFVPSR